ncbi:hypothetical protein MYAM1_004094 [Malassezia yamatoensis]|uniref:triacylglycerol lipase n=1 Tax=Malassezia yamatoensis TaxID=253288 RepID=A0AAJ5YZ35_9BASI|nr:hypothetical protein MYAM1_004094 [Malassezia yamatoensis]
MQLSHCLVLLLALVAQVFALEHSIQRRASIPTPPNDPFYEPPEGWNQTSPGDILRSRKVDLAFLDIKRINYKAAYQILYRTTGGYEDEPDTTVTTVIVPHNAQKNKLVNFLVFTDANGAQCAPSYSFREGSAFGTDLLHNYEELISNTFLDEGYIMTIPDYQGPTRAFAAGRLNGRMALDGVRATLNFERLGLGKNSKVVTHGYSGGAIASGWAAALHPSYAPEINAVGFSMGGTPTNVTNTVSSLDQTLFSGLCISGVTGFLFAYKKIQDWAQGRLTAKGSEAIEYTRNNCLFSLTLKYPLIHFFSEEYIRGGSDLLTDPVIRSVIADVVMGYKASETPTAPVYMFHAQHDEIVPFKDALKTGQDWADNGADVYFQQFTDLTVGHLFTEISNIPNILFFARDRFNGTDFPKGYTRKYSPNGLSDPLAPLTEVSALVKSVEDLLGRQVGPSDSIVRQKIKQQV